MLLKNLIKKLPKKFSKLNVKGLATNTKEVKKDFIFFAIKGNKFNGENYINEAVKKGSSIVVCSKNCKYKNNEIYIIKTKKIRNFLSKIASKFYKLKPKNIIAVTGTNGKTSVAEFFYQILNFNNIPVASIGTLGIRYKKKLVKTNLTTPDAITIHKNLEILKKNKINNVIIEASSHGLDQNRLDYLKLKAGIFTNFSQDHLDYHKSMKAYLKSKLILFSKLLHNRSFVISDKSLREFSLLKKISNKRKLKLLDISKKIAQIENIPLSLIGSFQIRNLSMAILAAQICNLNETKVKRALKKIKGIDGRLELVKKFPNNIKVFVDYAHTPDALFETLKSIKEAYNNHHISLVFGCGGERDFKKRSLMAKIARSLCNRIYVTDDNPRKENPSKIRNEIIKHLKGYNYSNIGNRSLAIKEAILKAEPNEIILVAGKGHESYQDYGNKIFSISDKQIIRNLNLKKDKITHKKQNYFINSKILNQIFKRKKLHMFDGLTIDSREVKKGNLFLTIKGKKNDGNKFISKAIKKGAKLIVSSRSNKRFKKKLIKVSDPNIFLNKFAILKRLSCKAKIIAITGSAGKTSLKNMLKTLLQRFDNTYASPKSFNNHFGVPISLSNLNPKHKFGVFEVGMSKAGEINRLSSMIKPDLAVITNIGEAHIENFHNMKGIAKAKSEIINNINKNGKVILNYDDKYFRFLSKKAKLKNIGVISFGKSKNSDIYPIKIKMEGDIHKLKIQVKNEIIKLKVKNINIYNVLASLAIIKELNLDLQETIRIFKDFEPSEGRGKIHKIKRYKKSFNLIDESYNANPLSVKNALNSFSAIKKNKSKKYLLMGDMLELGKKSEIYHKQLSRIINRSDIDKVFVKGEKMLFTYQNLKKEKRGNIFQCNQDIDFNFKNIIANNDYLMIKGSNATGLNLISNTMIKGN